MAKAKLLNSHEFENSNLLETFNYLISLGRIKVNSKGTIIAVNKEGNERKLTENDKETFLIYIGKVKEKLENENNKPVFPTITQPTGNSSESSSSPSSIKINFNNSDKVNFEECSIPQSWNKTWIKLKTLASMEGKGNGTKALSAHYWLKIMLSESISFEIASKALWAMMFTLEHPAKKSIAVNKITELDLPETWKKRFLASL